MKGQKMKKFRKLLLMVIMAVMMLVPADLAFADMPIPPIKPNDPIQRVSTLKWKGELLVSVRTKYGRFRAGKKVTILKTGYKCTILLKGHKFKIARRYLRITEDLASIVKGKDYNTKTKIYFANKVKRKSKTKYFIWVSLDKQRVNIYKGSSKRWRLYKVYKCTTGIAASTPLGYHTIGWKLPSFTGQYGSPLYYYMEFAGSGFHIWPGYGGAGLIGKHTQSHGCIRLTASAAEWMYKHIPIGTKVYIY